MKTTGIIINIILISFLLSCATLSREEAKRRPAVEPDEVLSPEEQEKSAFKKFNEILVVSRSAKDRKAALPEMEELYTELIDEYPDVPVAQESYWKLIDIYVKEYSPPAYEKADALYNKFLETYPQSGIKGLIEKTLAVSYYQNKEWGSLLRLTTPGFKGFIEKREPPHLFLLYMYAEANFQLGNYEEAEKGFQIVLEKFPQMNENKRAKARIEHIKKNR